MALYYKHDCNSPKIMNPINQRKFIMYAVISTGGKQYKVATGDTLAIELVKGNVGDTITFDNVLAVGEGADIKVGEAAKSASVQAEIVGTFRGEKLIVFKFKRRKGYSKKNGHRQNLMSVKIGEIKA